MASIPDIDPEELRAALQRIHLRDISDEELRKFLQDMYFSSVSDAAWHELHEVELHDPIIQTRNAFNAWKDLFFGEQQSLDAWGFFEDWFPSKNGNGNDGESGSSDQGDW